MPNKQNHNDRLKTLVELFDNETALAQYEKSTLKSAFERDSIEIHRTKELASDAFMRIDRVKHFVNLQIDLNPAIKISDAVKVLQGLYDLHDYTGVISICSCKKKLGVKTCSGCMSTKYCSRNCQVAAWPSHKGSCKFD
jgi:hypothetical protein